MSVRTKVSLTGRGAKTQNIFGSQTKVRFRCVEAKLGGVSPSPTRERQAITKDCPEPGSAGVLTALRDSGLTSGVGRVALTLVPQRQTGPVPSAEDRHEQ